MRDYSYIEELLESYFRAETTLHEERILRAFFMNGDVPESLAPYRSLFAVQEEMRAEKAPEMSLEAICREKAHRVNLRPFYRAAASVAIVLCIGMASTIGMGVGDDPKAPTTEVVNNPDAQYGEMEQMLTPHSSAAADKKDTLFIY